MRLVQHAGPELAAALDPAYPAEHPLVVGAEGSRSVSADGALGEDLLRELTAVEELLHLSSWAPASNSWVLPGSRTTTGAPILANDPHGALSMPSPWYRARLSAGDEELAGLTFVGAPFVAMGHNRRIAWGMVNAQVSIQDLYVERFNPNNPLQFQDPDGWQDAVRFRETIRVRGGAPVVEDVLVTRRGPIISPALPGRQPPISLRWVGLDSEVDSMTWALRLDQARDWKTFRAAVTMMSSPAMTVTYADVDGNIGYRLSAFIPIRGRGRGRLPGRGWEAGDQWAGFIPLEEMPEALNPPSGFVIVANNPVAGGERLVTEANSGYRARRIEDVLRAAGQALSIEDCVRLQADVRSLPGERLRRLVVERLDRPGSPEPGDPVLAALRDWDLELGSESAGGLAYEAVLARLAHLVLGAAVGAELRPHLLGRGVHDLFPTGPLHGRLTPVLLDLLEHGRVGPLAPPDAEARDGLLRRALAEAEADLTRQQGRDPRRWRWGAERRVHFDHPLGTAMRVLRPILSRGPFPLGGDGDTVAASDAGLGPGAPTVGAFYRAVYDLGDLSRSLWMAVPGQSGQPASAHYADLIPAWLAGRLEPIHPPDGEAVERLDLLPGSP